MSQLRVNIVYPVPICSHGILVNSSYDIPMECFTMPDHNSRQKPQKLGSGTTTGGSPTYHRQLLVSISDLPKPRFMSFAPHELLGAALGHVVPHLGCGPRLQLGLRLGLLHENHQPPRIMLVQPVRWLILNVMNGR